METYAVAIYDEPSGEINIYQVLAKDEYEAEKAGVSDWVAENEGETDISDLKDQLEDMEEKINWTDFELEVKAKIIEGPQQITF